MRNFTYPVSLLPEDRGHFTVQFADIPEAITSGKGRGAALVNAADCLDEAIAGWIAAGVCGVMADEGFCDIGNSSGASWQLTRQMH